jgi:integrase
VEHFVEAVYLPIKKESGDWRASTAKTAEYEIRRHILPELGPLTFEELEPSHLRSLLKDLAKAGLSEHPLKHVRGQLSEICRMAVAEGYLRTNISEGLNLPKNFVQRGIREQPTINLSDYHRAWLLLAERERLAFDLVLFAGLRESEVYGLQCGDIEAEGIHVQRSWYRGRYEPPKTGRTRRVGPPAAILERLKEWIAALPGNGPSDPVFPSMAMKTPLMPENVMKNYVRPKLKPAGLVVNFAMLRRSHSSEHKRIGSDVKVISEQQGHGVKAHMETYVQVDVKTKVAESEKLYAEYREAQQKRG